MYICTKKEPLRRIAAALKVAATLLICLPKYVGTKRRPQAASEAKTELIEQKYTLPDNVDESKIAAKVEDGILTIELPKIQREEGKTGRQIAIS